MLEIGFKNMSNLYEPVETFQFHDAFPEASNNGLDINNIHVPEEVMTVILTYVDRSHILKCSQVCKKWCNIVKSHAFWAHLYQRRYGKKPKMLPWYVYYCLFTTDYFDTNLIKNGNGQEQYNHWKIISNGGDRFRIEDPPIGADYLPVSVPEFNDETSCFATSYGTCNKLQEISFENDRLMQLIFNKFKPHIYGSEWVAGRRDCGCTYKLWCNLYGPRNDRSNRSLHRWRKQGNPSQPAEDEFALHVEQMDMRVEQWAGSEWFKIELLVKNYPNGVQRIVFQHEGKDSQGWAGHYGSKMAGGVLKILFDSIVEVCNK